MSSEASIKKDQANKGLEEALQRQEPENENKENCDGFYAQWLNKFIYNFSKQCSSHFGRLNNFHWILEHAFFHLKTILFNGRSAILRLTAIIIIIFCALADFKQNHFHFMSPFLMKIFFHRQKYHNDYNTNNNSLIRICYFIISNHFYHQKVEPYLYQRFSVFWMKEFSYNSD